MNNWSTACRSLRNYFFTYKTITASLIALKKLYLCNWNLTITIRKKK